MVFGGAGLRWRPLPQAEAPTEPTGETATFEIYQTSPPNLIYKPVDKLTAYHADIDKQAEDMFFRLVKQLDEKEGVTERLKADNQMLWVQRINSIRNRATEIVNAELIFT